VAVIISLASQGKARFWRRALLWRDGNLPAAACKPYRQGRRRHPGFSPPPGIESGARLTFFDAACLIQERCANNIARKMTAPGSNCRMSPVHACFNNPVFALPDVRVLFSDLNFSFNQERIGLHGQHGVGKSTLLHLVSGHLSPSAGKISVSGKLGMLRQRFDGRRRDDCRPV
jgi:ABC-type multidrug transport system fused ATPase/permease subunit